MLPSLIAKFREPLTIICFTIFGILIFSGVRTSADNLQTLTVGAGSVPVPGASDLSSAPADAKNITRRGPDLLWVTRTHDPIALPMALKMALMTPTSSPVPSASPEPDPLPILANEAKPPLVSNSKSGSASKHSKSSHPKRSDKPKSASKKSDHGKKKRTKALASPNPTTTPTPFPAATPIPTHLVDHIWIRTDGGKTDTELLQTPAESELPLLEFSVSPNGSRIVFLQHMLAGGVTLAMLERPSRAIVKLIDPQTTLSDDHLILLGWDKTGSSFWAALTAAGRVRLAKVEFAQKQNSSGVRDSTPELTADSTGGSTASSNSGADVVASEVANPAVNPGGNSTAGNSTAGVPASSTPSSFAKPATTSLFEVKWKFIDPSFGSGILDCDKGWVLESTHAPFRVLDFATLNKVTVPIGDAGVASDGSHVSADIPPRGATWRSGGDLEFLQAGLKFVIPSSQIAEHLDEALKKKSLLPDAKAPKPPLSGDFDLVIPRTPDFTRVPGQKLSLFATALHYAQISYSGLATSASGVQREIEELQPRRYLNEAVKACSKLKLPTSQNLCLLISTQIATGRARIEKGKISWLLKSPVEANFLTEFCQLPSDKEGIHLYRACLFDPESLLNFAFAPANNEVLANPAKKEWFCQATAEAREMVSVEFDQFVSNTCGKKSNADVGVDDGPCTSKLFVQEMAEPNNRENEKEALCRLLTPQATNQSLAASVLTRSQQPKNIEALHRYLLGFHPIDEESAREIVHTLIAWRDKEIVTVLTTLLQQRASETARHLAIAGFGELRDPRTRPILEAYAKSIDGDIQVVEQLLNLIEQPPSKAPANSPAKSP